MVGQDVWSPVSGWSARNDRNQSRKLAVTANMPAENTAVVSFPNSSQRTTTRTAGQLLLHLLLVYRNMNSVSGTSAHAAYDIWLNNWQNEVMIQH